MPTPSTKKPKTTTRNKRQRSSEDRIENEPENGDILEDLKKHLLGTYKVYFNSVTLDCGIERRGVCEKERLKDLESAMEDSLNRDNDQHGMHGFIENLEEFQHWESQSREIDVDDESFRIYKGPLIRLLAGLQRFHLLKNKLFPNQSDQWWWLMNVYDGNSKISTLSAV